MIEIIVFDFFSLIFTGGRSVLFSTGVHYQFKWEKEVDPGSF